MRLAGRGDSRGERYRRIGDVAVRNWRLPSRLHSCYRVDAAWSAASIMADLTESAGDVAAVSEIVAAMQEAAPPGLDALDDRMLDDLRGLTQGLMAAVMWAVEEYERFLSIKKRDIQGFGTACGARLGNRTVLVTGGTGSVGSALLAQIAEMGPRRLVSVSRGLTPCRSMLPNAEYVHADIRDCRKLTAVVNGVRPDVVFHLAAQRDPGLAEREVHRTVTTNIFGTRNVIAAAEQAGVPQVVLASTGKALRPYATQVYCASKKAAEWLAVAGAARSRTAFSAARFTHVVDNSIIHGRLLDWSKGGVVRLHNPHNAFYAQSARESAQLLLVAGLGAQPGSLRVHALTDLGWPVSLLDLAVGMLLRTDSTTPIYFSGHEPGYERMPFPGLYDLATAGEVSPLLSAFEAPLAGHVCNGAVNQFPLELDGDPARGGLLQQLEQICRGTEDPAPIRAALEKLSWSLLEGTLGRVASETLHRSAQMTAPFRAQLDEDQRRLLAAIQQYAGNR
jgi:hypothetical protein